MKPLQDNLHNGPLWGWEEQTWASVSDSPTLCTTLTYHHDFPVWDVANGKITIHSREHFDLDVLMDSNSMTPQSSPLLAGLSKDAFDFIRAAIEPEAGLTLDITQIIHLPMDKKAAFVFKVSQAISASDDETPEPLQLHAKTAHAVWETTRNAWQHAVRILKLWNHDERCAEFQNFLSYYSEVTGNPAHPVNELRRDLEDAIFSTGQMRHALRTREPRRMVVRDFLDRMPVGVIVEQQELPSVQLLSEYQHRIPNVSPPRDGRFNAIRLGIPGELTRWIVFWQPDNGKPPFPVVKAAACSVVPSILSDPLSSIVAPPVHATQGSVLPLTPDSATAVAEIHPPWNVDDADRILISDLTPTSRDPDVLREAAAVVRNEIRARGTEALAWHQGFHHHTASAWGIYFNAPKIDAFIQGVYAELMSATKGNGPNYGFTAMAIIQWIAEHEWFHARVEAALTYLELTSGSPRSTRYCENVYQPLACVSDDCIEEALANYTAQRCLLDGNNTWAELLAEEHRTALAHALEAEMRLSPPGYRAWERGGQLHSWRALAWELVTGHASAALDPLPPVESILLGPIHYDHLKSDIAWYVYGDGIVTDALLASPSTLAVPARKVLTKALRYLGYNCVESRGKGSHEMWFKEGGAGFPLPRKDPVGRDVFKTFLAHSGLKTKSRYIEEVRPHL